MGASAILTMGWAAVLIGGAWGLMRASRASVAVCVALALLIRVVVAIYTQPPTDGDPVYYRELVSHLIKGQGLWLDLAYYFDVRALYPPLYPILLAGVTKLLGDPAVATLNMLLDAGSALTIWLICRRMGDPTSGRIGAWLLAMYPTSVLSVAVAQKETLVVLLVSQLLLGFARRAPLHVGIAGGLIGLCQPVLAPLACVLGLMLAPAWGLPKTIRFGAVSALAAAAVMSPWWLRNWMLFGRFIPLTTSAGLSLKVAVDGWYYPLRPEYRQLAEPDRFAQAGRDAWVAVAGNPAAYLQRTVLNAGATFVRETRTASIVGPENGAAIGLLLQISWFTYAAGAFAALARKPPLLLFVGLGAMVVELLVFGVWFEFEQRHRIHLVVALSLLMSWAISSLALRRAAKMPADALRP